MSSIFQLSELSTVRLDLLSLYFFEFSRYAASDQTLHLLGNRESLVCQLVGQFILQSLGQSRAIVYNSVNVAEVKTRYEVGRYIFEDEQQGERAAYGKNILRNLSSRLIEKYGKDWSYDTLVRCRKFYQAYENAEIVATPLPQLEGATQSSENKKLTNCAIVNCTIWPHTITSSESAGTHN